MSFVYGPSPISFGGCPPATRYQRPWSDLAPTSLDMLIVGGTLVLFLITGLFFMYMLRGFIIRRRRRTSETADEESGDGKKGRDLPLPPMKQGVFVTMPDDGMAVAIELGNEVDSHKGNAAAAAAARQYNNKNNSSNDNSYNHNSSRQCSAAALAAASADGAESRPPGGEVAGSAGWGFGEGELRTAPRDVA